MAETTTTTEFPAFRVATIRCATRLMPSASATEEPPYFCTTRATVVPAPPGSGTSHLRCRVYRAKVALTCRRFLGHIQAGVRDDRVQRAQRGPAVGAPVVDVGVLPPPERLGNPARFIVLQAVDHIRRYRRKIV